MVGAERGKGEAMPGSIRASITLHMATRTTVRLACSSIVLNYFQRRGWFRLADGFKRLDCTLVEIPQGDTYRVEVARRFMQFLRLSSQACLRFPRRPRHMSSTVTTHPSLMPVSTQGTYDAQPLAAVIV